MLELSLDGGGTAQVEQSDGDRVRLLATRPSPPGSTLSGRAREDAPYLVKVRGCRRIDDAEPAQFRIEGRWVNLTRTQRQRVREG